HISTSIGISLCVNARDTSADDLLKQADTAMYHAKNSGRNTYCFFEDAMQKRADQRLKVEKELRYAIDNNQLELYYQPQLDSAGQCVSAEALVRWNHPERGVVAPGEFIPIAEESALIERLGRWVLRAGCWQLQEWQNDGIYLDHLAINVCARQFHCGDIVQDVRDALDYFGVDPSRIILEITESLIVENVIDTISKMNELKTLGVRISLDDFGTGYSSLRYLKQLPIHQLKIDQSFVRDVASDESDLVIVETILSMAHHLRLEVVAEGVETEEQLALLQARNCEYFQGYYFCRPVPSAQFVAYVEEARNKATLAQI
ncbi:MAG: bifunctional diguanylate cyclase/phosphodiesterase, partial [Spongiibacter sp.]|nr:bifunctional diguanylate cyclase/phosphodiesterase [Spongiibacter sp.]